MNRGTRTSASDSFKVYFAEINQHALLTVEEEQRLARAYRDGDTRAGHALITANLRFVVKIANEHRSYRLSLADLVQEGNVGLLKAAQKFDPDRGIRFVSYAVWWIRAYIQNHILTSYSLVKLGTTQAQRKLFFSLSRTKRELERMDGNRTDSESEAVAKIANRLSVKPSEVEEMSQRMGWRDVSLDAPVGEDGESSRLDHLAGEFPAQDAEICSLQERAMLEAGVGTALASLDARERFIVEQRIMADEPMSLKDLGEHFGVSRERARQLEIRAKNKLGERLQELAVTCDFAMNAPATMARAAA